MIVTLTGNNSHTLKARLDKLVADFVKEHGDLALERIDGEEADLQAIIEAVQSLPFLASAKMVVIKNLGSNKAASEAIEQIISSINQTTNVVFWQPVTDKRTAFYKTLKAQTQFEQFDEMEPHQLAKWLSEEAKNRDAGLSLSDADYLVKRVGPNQTALANELAKLTAYSPNINRESINLLVEPNPQSKVFDLLDAAFGGSKKRALDLYGEQRAQKVEPQEILAMMAWQLRLITLAKLAAGRSSAVIAKDAGLSPYPVSKAQGLAAKLSGTQLKDMVAEALRIDRLSKTKTIDLDEALKTYITTL